MTDFANKKWLKKGSKRTLLRRLAVIAGVIFAISIGLQLAYANNDNEATDVDGLFSAWLPVEKLKDLEQQEAEDAKEMEAWALMMSIEQVARDHGSPDPVRYTKAVMNTRFPRLITGIGVAEKGCFDPQGKCGKRGEKGFSQIHQPDWGRVGDTIEAQVKKTETVLAALLEESHGSEEVALRKYNAGNKWRCGDAKRYAATALAVARDL